MAALQLVHSAWLTAIVFSMCDALVLNVSIRTEN
jgi:methyltransferase